MNRFTAGFMEGRWGSLLAGWIATKQGAAATISGLPD